MRVEAVTVLTAAALRVMSEETATIGYVLLAGYATTGRSQAIYAFVMSWLFGALNPGMFPTVENATVLRYLVIAGGVASIVIQGAFARRWKRDRIFRMTLLLGVFLVTHSMLFSNQQTISILKAILWGVTMASIIVAWEDLSVGSRYVLARRIYRTLILIALVSVPLMLLDVGYLLNDRGFQGVLNHPQALGIVMALLGAWAIPSWLADRRPRWSLAVSALAVSMIVLSGARTGGFALAIGVTVMVIARSRGRLVALIRYVVRSRVVLLLVTVGTVFVLTGGVLEYIEKRPEITVDRSTAAELYVRSRGVLILPMIRNILEDPIVGIGFGVPSSLEDVAKTDKLLGIPTSAAVEKGVMPLAVLEEVGVVGLGLVGIWLWMGFTRSVRNGPSAVAVIVTTLAVNFGEAILFSPGGTGLLFMVAIGWAISWSMRGRAMALGTR
ncbi:MAG: hypothetical protein OXJ90_13705 [Spirochaetaceae bacterium]|nr:hypothetical protein [Spirochaetaceae bacterium]